MSAFSAIPGDEGAGSELDDMGGPSPLDALAAADPADYGETTLDELVAEIQADVAPDPEVLLVTLRPGYSVQYDPPTDGELLKQWGKAAQIRTKGGKVLDVDLRRYSATILANTCRGILRNGQPISDTGRPVTFATEAFRQLLHAPDAATAVLRFYASDGEVIEHAQAVVQAGGFGADVQRADPTRRSSSD